MNATPSPGQRAPTDLPTQIRRLVSAQGAHSRWDRYGLCCALDLRPSELEAALPELTGWCWSDATQGATLIRAAVTTPTVTTQEPTP